MTIDLENKSRALRVSNILKVVVMLAISPVAINYLWLETQDKMIEMFIWLLPISVIVLYYIGGFCYVEVRGTETQLDVKYYSLFPFWREYKRVVLPLERIKYIKVRNGMAGLGSGLVICARVQGRIAVYPLIGLSACSRSQINQLKEYAAFISKTKS